MTPADVLRKAAARVRVAWLQGDFRDRSGADADTCGVCAIGAISWVADSTPGYWDLLRGCQAGPAMVLYEHLGTNVAKWNDAPGRTAEEVATAMEAAADAWDTAHPEAVTA